MNVKVQVFGGRLVGFVDHLGRPHRFGTMATAPMCRLDEQGNPVVTGGDPAVVAQLTEALKKAMEGSTPVIVEPPMEKVSEDKPEISDVDLPKQVRPRVGRKKKKK